MYSEHCQTFKMERFAKKNFARVQVCNEKFFRARRGRFVELEPFDKDSVKNTGKRRLTGKNFGGFSPRFF